MTHDELAAMEARSIREYVAWALSKGFLRDRVLDYGCGEQPYREAIEIAGHHYDGYDRAHFGGSRVTEDVGVALMYDANAWDSILCTQIVNHVLDPAEVIHDLYDHLFVKGFLVMTYPTTWPEIRDDLWRFTERGMNYLLTGAGFTIRDSSKRGAIVENGFELPIGYGVVAQRG